MKKHKVYVDLTILEVESGNCIKLDGIVDCTKYMDEIDQTKIVHILEKIMDEIAEQKYNLAEFILQKIEGGGNQC